MNRAALSLGANIGDRLGSIRRACAMLDRLAGTVVLRSDVYETEPWGVITQRLFMNACVVIETVLEPEALLDVTKKIESDIGRVERGRWADREIDIDILLYGSELFTNDKLTIPHILMHERPFVLYPLESIAPEWVHPKLNLTVSKMRQALDCSDIIRITGI